MGSPHVMPFGAWVSPLSADMAAGESLALSQVRVDGTDVYWVEGRPRDKGRQVVVRRAGDGTVADVTPTPYSARSRVHEYGGGAYTVTAGTVLFTNCADQQVYGHVTGQPPTALTHTPEWRYADLTVTPDGRRLLAVCEQHDGSDHEPRNVLVSITLSGADGGRVSVLVSGPDFVSHPRPSPDGHRLAWLQWDHPHMPWDGNELWLAEVDDDGRLGHCRRLAGGDGESICQPEWGPSGDLVFVSDRTGWWNLYGLEGGQVRALLPMEAEFGLPQWAFGQSTYAFVDTDTIVAACNEHGLWRLGRLQWRSGRWTPVETGFSSLGWVRYAAGHAVLVGGSHHSPTCVARIDMETGRREAVRHASAFFPPGDMLSDPERVTFATGEGEEAYAFLYAPRNADFRAPPGDLPPLLVRSHGGPTGAFTTALSLEVQYWTSRGYAVAEVNYRGSTGYGTAYRNALRGRWGVADVEDCASLARHLVATGRADGQRVAIRGGSAGGFTALAALTTCDVFRAGASYYGVSDLETLARDTHKFESRYLDGLIGPYPARRDLYLARSPIHAVDRLACPLILFQGLEDKVVPPAQSQTMYDALLRKGLPVAYVAFESEQHGFRLAENVRRCLEAELCFYGAVFRLPVWGTLRPPEIGNLRDEWFGVVDEQDTVIGLALRSLCHGHPELVHRTAHVVVLSADGRLLLQKRSARKDIQPGRWDTAVGGHLALGETYEQAASRELAEELGVQAPGELPFLFRARIRNAVESENVTVFRLVSDGPFRPPPAEIDELRFWSTDAVLAALGTGAFTPNLESEVCELRGRGLLG